MGQVTSSPPGGWMCGSTFTPPPEADRTCHTLISRELFRTNMAIWMSTKVWEAPRISGQPHQSVKTKLSIGFLEKQSHFSPLWLSRNAFPLLDLPPRPPASTPGSIKLQRLLFELPPQWDNAPYVHHPEGGDGAGESVLSQISTSFLYRCSKWFKAVLFHFGLVALTDSSALWPVTTQLSLTSSSDLIHVYHLH